MEILREILNFEERSGAWLSRKLGVSRACVSYWLNGKTIPSEVNKIKIASLLGIDKSKLQIKRRIESD
jgi:transcriptional regulator with XRE-family HTH domain